MPHLVHVFISLVLPAAHAAAPVSLVIETEYGKVGGFIKGSVRHFRGIPYAAPPVGDLRWRPPQRPEPWNGTRPYSQSPIYCAQAVAPAPFGTEDCLYLNVATTTKLPSTLMPVQLWIHGGGMKVGSAFQPLYDGDGLVTYTQESLEEPVVLVSINYRLDVFGQLVHRGLVAEQKNGPLNYALQDMCFAMQWVQDNVGKFGGDPKRVMIHGESGGGWATTALLFADGSVTGCGKFAAAVGESIVNWLPMPYAFPSNTMATNLQRGDKLESALGCSQKEGIDCMRSKPFNKVIVAGYSKGIIFDIVVDGVMLPDVPGKMLQQGRFHKVPIIMGSCTNEAQLFQLNTPVPTLAEFKLLVRKLLPQLSEVGIVELTSYYVEKYPLSGGLARYKHAVQGFVNDLINRCSSHALAKAYAAAGQKSYMYIFGYEYNDGMDSWPFNSNVSSHGCELSFFFGDPHFALDFLPTPPRESFTPMEQALANRTMSYISTFAAHGDPNHAGDVRWPAATSKTHFNVSFGMNIDNFTVQPDALDGCALFEKLGLYDQEMRFDEVPCTEGCNVLEKLGFVTGMQEGSSSIFA